MAANLFKLYNHNGKIGTERIKVVDSKLFLAT